MGDILKATHEGEFKLGELKLKVAVLSNEQRIINQSTVFQAFGRPIRGSRDIKNDGDQSSGKLPGLIDANNLKPFISEDLEQVIIPIKYLDKSGRQIQGYDSTILAHICEVYLDADKAIKKNGTSVLTAKQKPNAVASERLSRVLMRISLIALIDEATGFQDVRMKDALEKIADQMLLASAKKYEVTYPLELYKQWFRLNDWEWKPENAQKRPGVIGTWTNKYIYERMADGLLAKLETRNPKNEKGYRQHKHFEFLTEDIGEPKLREFFGGLIALARASSSWKRYIELVERAYPIPGDQMKLDTDE